MLEYREEHEKQLRETEESLRKLKGCLTGLDIKIEEGNGLNSDALVQEIEKLNQNILQRLARVSSPRCRIAVIGLEKQGKSTFVNAWIGKQALPSDTNRCTWASSTIINGLEPKANIQFASKDKLDADIDALFNELGGMKRSDLGFPLPDDARDNEKIKGREASPAFQDLEQLSRHWPSISPNLNRSNLEIRSNTIGELYNELFNYLSLRTKDGIEQGQPYAVEHADIYFDLTKNTLDFAIDDLPGINAPGNRAEKMTWNNVENKADIIIYVKSASANASLDGNEEKVWDKAKNSDGAIKLTDRLFVILNQADYIKSEHGRDCHLEAFNNFRNRGVPENRVFYCSSRAELYDAARTEPSDVARPELSFDWNDDQQEAAINRIGTYKNQNPTTGFPEFKRALYDFLEKDFMILEKKAFEVLLMEFDTLKKKLCSFIEGYYSSAVSERYASQKEIERFAALWAPEDLQKKETDGLKNAILVSLNTEIRNVITNEEIRINFQNGIKATIAKAEEDFLKTITVDGFENIDFRDQGSVLKRFSSMKSKYYEKIQGALKNMVYESLSLNISQNIKEQLKAIWRKSVDSPTPEAISGLAAIGIEQQTEFFSKQLQNRTNFALVNIFHSDCEPGNFAFTGFAALLKSIAHAPSEYLFMIDDNDYNSDKTRLINKARLHSESLTSLNKKGDWAEDFSNNAHDSEKLMDVIQKNLPIIKEIISLFISKPYSVLVDVVADTAMSTKENQAKANPFAKAKESNDLSSGKKAETNEDVVEDLKKRVKVFFYILNAMLFDNDFGFIGYYRAFLEEFRMSIISEMNESGAIRSFAFKYREQIWVDESEFKKNNERERIEQVLNQIKALCL